MSAQSNLPAASGAEAGVPAAMPAESDAGRIDSQPSHRPLGVAFLPLALATFLIIAFVLAAWTFMAAAP